MEFNNLLNIGKLDIEKEIIKVIKDTKEELAGLDVDRTCMIYTSYLYKNFKKRHILSYIIDTSLDLNLDYLHRFIIVPFDNDKKYIVDLTYSQFNRNDLFKEIYDKGYQLLDNNMYKKYINNILESVKKGHKR